MSIKIAIDIRLLRGKTGMHKYLSEMVDRLNTFKDFEYYHLGYQRPRRNLLEKIFDAIYEQYWMQLKVPGILKKEKIKLLYSPNPPTSLFTSIPIVLTIPDLLFYLDPNLNWFFKTYLYWEYRFSALKAKTIITFSEYSKRNIAKILKVIPDKIVVISPCIKEEVFGQKLSDSKVAQVMKRFKINKKIILNIPGTFVARKNVEDLLISFNKLPKKIKDEFKLVFIGNDKHPSYSGFIEKVRKLGLEDHVVATGYISEEELRAFYQEAYMLVVTAIYEGFALPPLEAMREGLPVIAIAYGDSSLSEVLGNTGLIVNNRTDLTKAMQDLITKSKLRHEMVKKGLAQAKKYNWNDAVQRIIQVIHEAI